MYVILQNTWQAPSIGDGCDYDITLILESTEEKEKLG